MRFKFCGDLDCPDWLLLEIMNLSKLSTVKVKLLALHCVKCIIDGDKMDLVKIQQHLSNSDLNDSKSVIAALHFIIVQAAKYDTIPSTLSEEIQQLGLPKEHSGQIVKCYEDNFDNLISLLKRETIRNSCISQPIKWNIKTPIENRLTRIILSDAEMVPLDPLISIDVQYKKADCCEQTKLPLTMNYLEFRYLKSEIKRLVDKIGNLSKVQW